MTVLETTLKAERRWVWGAGTVLLLMWSAWAGRDVSWDLLNHHVYLPFSLLTGRFETDLFAAGPQSYQNPVGYLLFYLPLSMGWPNWLAGLWLTALHALLWLPLHALSVSLWGDAREQRWWRLMASALAGMTPVFLYYAGTSSTDPLTTTLLLAGLATLMRTQARARTLGGAGLLVGLAIAIKPSNAIMAIALFAISGWRLSLRQLSWRGFLLFWAGATLSVLLFWGPWAYWLWTHFDNPVFPLYNHLFGSPYAPQQAMLATRFLPENAADWLLRPFQMARLVGYTNVEGLVPDLRPALLVLALPIWGARHLMRLRPARGDVLRCLSRSDVQLLAFALLTYALCMASSGNARYAMVGLMPVGLLLVRAAQDLLPERAARIVLGVLLLLHSAHYLIGGDRRMNAEPWNSDPYVAFDVAPQLREQPYLHLSIGSQSIAGIAPLLHADGALVNLVGQMSMPVEGPLAQAFEERLVRWQARTRLLLAGQVESINAEGRAQLREHTNHLLARYGLASDFSDCLDLRLKRFIPGESEPMHRHWVSCAAHRVARQPLNRFEKVAERIFARVEAACPRIFGPTPLISESTGDSAQRLYLNTDLFVTVIERDGVVVSHHRTMNREWLGMPDEVAEGRGKDPCAAWERLKAARKEWQ